MQLTLSPVRSPFCKTPGFIFVKLHFPEITAQLTHEQAQTITLLLLAQWGCCMNTGDS